MNNYLKSILNFNSLNRGLNWLLLLAGVIFCGLVFYYLIFVALPQISCPRVIKLSDKIENKYDLLYEWKDFFKIKSGQNICSYGKKDNQIFELIQESNVKYTTPKKIAILYISTGKYIIFWEKFYAEMEKYFLPKHQKTYFLFTDHMDIPVADNVVKVETKQQPWPYITLKRYHFFMSVADKLKEYDYIYFLNGTLLPQTEIDEEIFPTDKQGIMVTLHPGFLGVLPEYMSYERNPLSQAYIADTEGKYYVAGGFNGGTAKAFLNMSEKIREMTDTDLKNNIIPGWHDESMLNRYLIDYMKSENALILMPEYLVPDGWGNVFGAANPKILILNKSKYGGHDYLRKND